MSTFKPHGTAHDALDALSRGGVTKRDVRRSIGLPTAKQGKANALIENLRRDGLVTRRSCGFFYLTQLGEEVRSHLESGHVVPVEFGVILMEAA